MAAPVIAGFTADKMSPAPGDVVREREAGCALPDEPHEIGAFTADQINTLGTSLTAPQISALSTTQIAGISSTTISSFSTAQLQAITTKDVAALSTDQVTALSTAQVTSKELAADKTEREQKCGGLTYHPADLATVDKERRKAAGAASAASR